MTYTNQPQGVESRPDASISARFAWYFETKTVRGRTKRRATAASRSALTASC